DALESLLKNGDAAGLEARIKLISEARGKWQMGQMGQMGQMPQTGQSASPKTQAPSTPGSSK
ncbi:hypothetical protein ACVBEH_31680, partial [Roseateles sp. GG27B]